MYFSLVEICPVRMCIRSLGVHGGNLLAPIQKPFPLFLHCGYEGFTPGIMRITTDFLSFSSCSRYQFIGLRLWVMLDTFNYEFQNRSRVLAYLQAYLSEEINSRKVYTKMKMLINKSRSTSLLEMCGITLSMLE